MVNVIVLEPVENESIRKVLAVKILASRMDISYFRLLEQLTTGGFDYFIINPNEEGVKLKFESAIAELNELGVKYRIVKKEADELSQNSTESEDFEQEPEQKPEQKAEQKPEQKTEQRRGEKTMSDDDILHAANLSDRDEAELHRGEKTMSDDDILHAANLDEDGESSRHHPTTKTMSVYGSSGSRGAGAGIGLGNLVDDDEFGTEEEPKEKGHALKVLFGILVFAGLLFLMYYINQHRSDKEFSGARKKQTLQMQFDDALADADRACVEGLIDTEKMYRLAISLNQNNLGAWAGLLRCFEKKNDGKKVVEIREEMRKIFGDYVFSVLRAVEPYGTPESFSPSNNTCKITYLRSEKSDNADGELFSIASSLSNVSSFDGAVIFAKHPDNSGYQISVKFADFPKNFDDFQRKITVNKVGN
ncbi:MAG: hypothetical protein FWF51_02880 [Chitinivibrionia bacterium]|nr:hypothetical protein [Chitinivibrionia bacterium]